MSAVAGLLQTSTNYIYDLIKAGELAIVELGNGRAKQRVTTGELDRFIESWTFAGRTE